MSSSSYFWGGRFSNYVYSAKHPKSCRENDTVNVIEKKTLGVSIVDKNPGYHACGGSKSNEIY